MLHALASLALKGPPGGPEETEVARKARQIQAPGPEQQVWADLVVARNVTDQVLLGRKARTTEQAVAEVRGAGYVVIQSGGYATLRDDGYHVTCYRKR